MMNQPPGLPHPGGGSAPPGLSSAVSPPPGFNGPNMSSLGNGSAQQGGPGSVSTIVKAQIVFLLSTLSEESWERNSGEIRALASQHGPEMYHHFLRRLLVVASPILQSLQSQSQSLTQPAPPPGLGGPAPAGLVTGNAAFVINSDRPLRQGLVVPQNGAGVLAWRLLESEGKRVCRDPTLAPHFALILLHPIPPSSTALLPLNLLSLPSPYLFSLASHLLSPHARTLLPASHPLRERASGIMRGVFDDAISALREQGREWWGPSQGDLNINEGRGLIFSVYPVMPEDGNTSSIWSKNAPQNKGLVLPLDSPQRELLLQSLSVKFSSPALILQALPSLSPGGGLIPLSQILLELGDGLTSDEQVVREVVGRWLGGLIASRGRAKEEWEKEEGEEDEEGRELEGEVAGALAGIGEGIRDGRGVDVVGVVRGIDAIGGLDWAYIIKTFDLPNSVLALASNSQPILSLLISILSTPLTNPQTPHAPIDGLLSQEWGHPAILLKILPPLLALSPEQFSISTLPTLQDMRMITAEDLRNAGVEGPAIGIVGSPWNCLKMFEVIASISRHAEKTGREEESLVEEVLERGARACGELVLMGLIQSPKPWSTHHTSLVRKLLPVYLDGTNPLSTVIYSIVGRAEGDILAEALTTYYGASEMNIGRIVDVGQDGNVLPRLLSLEGETMQMALDVAAFASKREMMNLETWVTGSINAHGEDYIHAVLDFLDHKIHVEGNRDEEVAETAPISPSIYAIFFRALRASEILSGDDINHFKEIRNFCLQIHPRLMNLGPHSDAEPGLAVVSFPADVDAQVDDFYQRMYAEEISLDHVMEVFRNLKGSEAVQDHELFACMLHTLFDEYKFVHTYPPRELAMTGLLFGSIIQHRLIEGTPLHVAVRYVLDALQSQPDSTMFTFGKNALNIFQSRLPEFPLMCQALLQIPFLHETNPLLISIIRTALTDRDPEGESGTRSRAGSLHEVEPVIFTALQLDELDGDEDVILDPEEDVSDKILFIINNLALNNFDSKIEEMRSKFESKYSRWFANYLVNTRVSVEPNNHQLYLQLLEGLRTPVLEKHVLWETYKKSFLLLNQEKTVTDTQDRATLKNLGSWLGRMTLAKDRPIRHRHLSVKDLLLQGYDAKRLIVALPYICKIMEQCAPSRVFHPPNPWLMAVMRFLAELYNFGDLKLTLKFEIEVLCKSLNMSLDDLEPTTILRSRTPPTAPAQPHGGLAQELDRITLPAGGYLGGGAQGSGSLNQQGLPSEATQVALQEAFLRRVDELVNSLPEFLIFSSAYPLFQTNPALKRVVHHSIDRAVREIINPVVERSVTIAGISSRDLLMKDFGMEGDENKLRQAAHLMVQKLAGSLALVTCKEPLRTSMTNNIRNTMLTTGFTEENMPDQAIAGIVQDNLEVACSVIKNAAQEKAVKDIDVNLSPAYHSRRQQREAGQLFYDPTPFTTTVSQSALPESLRLLQHGLQPMQLRVYEDFGDQSRFALQAGAPGMVDSEYPPLPSMHTQIGMQDGGLESRAMQQRGAMGGYGRPDGSGMVLGETLESSIMGAKLTVAQSMEKFQDLVAEMNRVLARLPADDLTSLSMSHDIKMIIRQIPMIATQSVNTDQTALAFSQKVVQLLYKSDALLSRDVYVTILQRLCDLFPKVAKEVTQWLIYAEDIRKFNVPVTTALIRAGLINVPEQDMQMAKIIVRDFAPPAMDFTADLIRECLLSETPCASRNQLANSLDALVRAASQRRATNTVERLLEDIQARTGLRSAPLSENSAPHGGVSPRPVDATVGRPLSSQAGIMQQPIDPELRHTLTIYFLEWVRLFTSPLPVEASFVPFVNRLQKQGILKGEEVSSAFYRNSIALAIDIYSKHKASGSPQMFHGVDALSKLIALLLKNYSDTHGVSSDSAKTLYFAKIFTIAALSLVRDHEELGAAFEQRPYYRFFSSLLSDLQGIQSSFPSAYYGCLRTFANHLGSIQPAIVPGFAFSWMALMSHRFFMPRLLQVANKEGWADFYRVLMALFKFLNPFLQAAELHQPSRVLFKGALRIMLVILKDFPEFLVEHYIGLCAAIPAHCIQLRNVVLCAFPRGVVLRQDYSTLAELPAGAPDFQVVPEVRTDYVRFLEEADIKKAIDLYIQRDSPNLSVLLPEIRNHIAISISTADGTPGVTYNLTLLYSLTLYLGAVAVDRSIQKNGQVIFDPAAPEVALLTGLVSALDGEGQYNFINSVANQLRYPNAHTLFFMHYLLHLFATAPNGTDLAERITRVLLERVLAQRPHPAGLTLTMSTLLREPRYNFFGHPWARPENQPELFAIFQRCAGK